jgi:hypothetical protein
MALEMGSPFSTIQTLVDFAFEAGHSSCPDGVGPGRSLKAIEGLGDGTCVFISVAASHVDAAFSAQMDPEPGLPGAFRLPGWRSARVMDF